MDPSKQVKLGSLSGLVPKEKAMAFERILFRATRGNIFLRQEPIDEPVTDPVSGEKVGIYFLSNIFIFLILRKNCIPDPFKIFKFDSVSHLFAQLIRRKIRMITNIIISSLRKWQASTWPTLIVLTLIFIIFFFCIK